MPQLAPIQALSLFNLVVITIVITIVVVFFFPNLVSFLKPKKSFIFSKKIKKSSPWKW
uniref:ATP synthase F0 subunit 8 n=1 Tax=Rhynchocinetes brucei TaxID=1531312 RepID=UPI0026E18FCC|nr:ATP synthase F0 subunit 8 [Rhynchocinetes brucei]WJM99846.1 ATP synthase F0 subunit 8 [Rhynchocinetes brucei]